MKKGYILTVDALMALVFILTIVLVSVTVQVRNNMGNTERAEFKRIHYVSEDALEALNKQGMLDVIGGQWALSNSTETSVYWSNASNLSRDALDPLIPERMSYKLVIDNDTVYQRASMNENASSVKTRSLRVLTGYSPGLPPSGYVARAYLAGLNKQQEAYVYGWQRTVSSGKEENILNVTTRFSLPSDFSSSKCNNATLHAIPRTYPNNMMLAWLNTQLMTTEPAVEITNDSVCGYLNAGDNTLRFSIYDDLDLYEIGKGSGTRLQVDYNTSSTGFNITKRFYLDSVESYCGFKQQFSLLMPGNITSITIHLETEDVENVDLALVLNGVIRDLNLNRTPDSNGAVDFSAEELSNEIDYRTLQDRVYSFNIYIDTNMTEYDRDSADDPDCFDPGIKRLLENSYIDVDYRPIPTGTDMYAYNFMSKTLEFHGLGDPCEGITGYRTVMESNYSIPTNAFPWVVDTWPAWVYEGNPDDLLQEMSANNREIYSTSSGDEFERHLVRFGYSSEGNTLIQPGNNTFVASGEIDMTNGLDQYCLSSSSTAGTVTFLFRSFVDYGNVFRESDGCILNITFNDGTRLDIQVGNDTVNHCSDDTNDAIADSLMRLMTQLDWDPATPGIDIKFTPEDLYVENKAQGRVRSLWGPALFRLVIWV